MRQTLIAKWVVCGAAVVALLVGVVWAEFIVMPNGLQINGFGIRVGARDVTIQNTEPDGDLYFKVKDHQYMRNVLRIDASDNCQASFYADLDVGDDLDVSHNLKVDNDIACSQMSASTGLFANLAVMGRISSTGGYDPPYVLYNQQSRAEIIERVKNEVPPDKQDGAALFFNEATKRLETYVASEGKFYDLQGKRVHELPEVISAATPYETTYYLDPATGQVKTRQQAMGYRYGLREGFALDEKTGRFIDERTGLEAAPEDALEWCVDNHRVYYDMQGNVLRSAPEQDGAYYVTGYQFDSQTGNVKIRRKAVQDRYFLKDGYEVDRHTGEFVDTWTGEIVEKEQAVQLIRASDTARRRSHLVR